MDCAMMLAILRITVDVRLAMATTALPDKDRPLGDRGRRDAPKMGKRLAKRDVKPDLILSSPARRALTTAEIIAKKLNYKRKDIVVDDRLYAAAVHGLLNVIHGLGDKLERVILFGHNPELAELAHRLSGEITHMPTCAVAEFTFNANRQGQPCKSGARLSKEKEIVGQRIASVMEAMMRSATGFRLDQ
jgi:phosphohistidine phosphatase